MPPGMIISNGMGGFIQYPQTISPFGAMQFSQAAGAHQLAQMGQMQMILQPAMNIRHVSNKILCTYLWCLTRFHETKKRPYTLSNMVETAENQTKSVARF